MSKTDFKINLKVTPPPAPEPKKTSIRPKISKKNKLGSFSRKLQKQRSFARTLRKEPPKEEDPQKNSVKTSKNWVLCWSRVPNVLEGGEDIWIQRWVRSYLTSH